MMLALFFRPRGSSLQQLVNTIRTHGAAWIAAAIAYSLVSPSSGQIHGIPDTSFRSTGYASYFPQLGDRDVRGGLSAVMALGDGKVLGVGECSVDGSPTRYACLHRWTEAGMPDSSFGNAGTSVVILQPAGTPIAGSRVTRRPNGRLLVAALCSASVCVADVNPNGIGYDTSFGSGGIATLALPAGVTLFDPRALIVHSDGRVWVGGTCYHTHPLSSACMARLTPSGSLDPTFGSGGWAVTVPAEGDTLRRLIPLEDGRVLALAHCRTGGSGSGVTYNICALMMLPGGTFQYSFSTGQSGRQNYLIDARVLGSDITLLWFTWESTLFGTQRHIWAARRNWAPAAAPFDLSFGGYPSSGIAGGLRLSETSEAYPGWLDGGVLREGSMVVIGDCNSSLPWDGRLCSVRLSSNAAIDTAWGTGGRHEIPSNDPSEAFMYLGGGFAQANDGKALVGGACAIAGTDSPLKRSRPCVLRLANGPQRAPHCSLDIDGDGVVNPLTDGLILVRTMLGLSGTAALANATGPGATRATWPQVRNYLWDQCQLPVKVN